MVVGSGRKTTALRGNNLIWTIGFSVVGENSQTEREIERKREIYMEVLIWNSRTEVGRLWGTKTD